MSGALPGPPPHNLQAERALLGAAFLEPAAIRAVLGLPPEAFYKDAHRDMHAAIATLHTAGRAVDVITVAAELEQRGRLEAIGGHAYLALLVEEATVGTAVGEYAAIVREHARKRSLARVSRMALNGGRSAGILEQLERELRSLEDPAGSVRTPPRVVDAVALLGQTFPDDPAIVAGGVIERGTFNLLGGAKGLGKTMMLLNLLVSRSVGLPWLGYATTPGRSLLFQAEVPERHLQQRLRLMLQDLPSLPVGTLFTLSDRSIRLDTPEGQRRVRQLVEECTPDLVGFDPLARFFAGRENDGQDLGRVIGFCDELIQAYGLAVLLSHHTAKPNRDDGREGGDRLRGHSSLFGAADSLLLLERQGAQYVLTLKLRHAMEPAPLTLQRTDTLWFIQAGPPAELLDVVALVAQAPLTWGELVKAVMVDQEASQRTAERLVKRAREAGLIAPDPEKRYHRTAIGRHAESGGEASARE